MAFGGVGGGALNVHGLFFCLLLIWVFALS